MTLWRLFRKPSAPARTPRDSWWAEADRIAAAPDAAAVDALEQTRDGTETDPDTSDLEEEMVFGLRQLVAIADRPQLPTVVTQHRVIGADICHMVTPVTIPGDAGAAAMLFLTATRCLTVGPRTETIAWHRVRRVTRVGRRVVIDGGGDCAVDLLCNTFGDALTVAHLAGRLAKTSGS